MSASVTPLGSQHDEIERVRRLDLEPAAAAVAGLVRRVQGLGHDALVPGIE
jgi:hypothetical protein